jgi:multidrug resistance protein, MATE family
MGASESTLATTRGAALPLVRLWTITYPIVLGNLATIALGVADTAILGRYGTEALTAVALAYPVYFVAAMLSTGWATAAQVLASRRFGAGETAAAGRVLDTGLAIGVGAALPLLVLLVLLATPVLRALGGETGAAGAGATYLRIVAAGLPFVAATAMFRAVYTGLGATKVALWLALLVNAVNIPLDLFLIFRLDLGATGSALGTLSATATGAGFMLLYGRRRFRGSMPFLRPEHLRAWRQTAPAFWRIGWPETAMLFLGYFTSVIVVRFAAQLGVAELGGWRILSMIITVIWTVIFATSTGIAILIGQRLGAGDLPGAQAAQRAGLLLMALLAAAVSLPALAAPRLLIGLFTGDAAIVDAAAGAVIIVLGQVPLMVLGMVMAAALRAGGDTKSIMYASLIADYAVYVPLAFLLTQVLDFGLRGLFLGTLTFWMVRLAITYLRYARGAWKTATV